VKIYGVLDENRSNEEINQLLEKMSSKLNTGDYAPESFVMDKLGFGILSFRSSETKEQAIWHIGGSRFTAIVGKVLDDETNTQRLLSSEPRTGRPPSGLELVLHGLQQEKEDLRCFLRKLDGVFILIIYDRNDKTLVIANDKYGLKPFFYYCGKSNFTFGSEVKALLCDDTIERKVNWDGWRDRLAYGFPLGTKTLFRDVHSLTNASLLTLEDGKTNIEKYWSYNEITINRENSKRYIVNGGIRFVRKALRKWTRNLEECVVFLSGGYDSRCIATCVRNFTDINFETFTTRQTLGDEIYATRIAKCLKVKNTYVPLPDDFYERYFVRVVYLLDGACSSSLWTWIMPLIESLGEHGVNLDGIAGDVLLGGFTLSWRNLRNIDNDCRLASTLDKERRSRARRSLGRYYYLIKSLRPPTACDFFDHSLQTRLAPGIHSILEEIKTIRKGCDRVTIFDLENVTRNYISPGPNNLISLRMETYFPFVETDLVEFALSIPPEMRNKKLYFEILKQAFPEVMKIKSTNDVPPHKRVLAGIEQILASYLPESSLETAKKIYVTAEFLFTRRQIDVHKVDYLTNLLNNLTIPSFVKKSALLRCTQEFLKRRIDPSFFLEPVVEFCIWYNLFVLDKPLESLCARA
jgi:asparagine synthase (glutamine-hydrolysing)